MRGDSGVAGEGRVVGVPKFHSWGKWTMPLTNINSDWMSNTSSGLCSILLTLGAHAQRGLQYLVCVSVTQHLTFHVFIRATNDTNLPGGG